MHGLALMVTVCLAAIGLWGSVWARAAAVHLEHPFRGTTYQRDGRTCGVWIGRGADLSRAGSYRVRGAIAVDRTRQISIQELTNIARIGVATNTGDAHPLNLTLAEGSGTKSFRLPHMQVHLPHLACS
jgi:hypothetical protein